MSPYLLTIAVALSISVAACEKKDAAEVGKNAAAPASATAVAPAASAAASAVTGSVTTTTTATTTAAATGAPAPAASGNTIAEKDDKKVTGSPTSLALKNDSGTGSVTNTPAGITATGKSGKTITIPTNVPGLTGRQ